MTVMDGDNLGIRMDVFEEDMCFDENTPDTLRLQDVSAYVLRATEEKGANDPDSDEYNPDGFCITGSLPAPYSSATIQVIVPIPAIMELNREWCRKSGLPDPYPPEGVEVIPLSEFLDRVFEPYIQPVEDEGPDFDYEFDEPTLYPEDEDPFIEDEPYVRLSW